jgi:hypothetical protein
MATKKDATIQTTGGMRRCIGSTTFGIEAHEAPVEEFPVQASAKDGLGRMCKPHWRQYTNALRKASVARKAEVAEASATPEAMLVATAEPKATRQLRSPKPAPAEVAAG